jgi:Spy/CpxP family protein refolding chaperone
MGGISMRIPVKGALTLCLTVSLMAAAQAQGPQRGGAGSAGLLMNPSVKKELKLTDDQLTKIQDALGKVQDKHKDDFARFREMSVDERRKMMRSISEDYNKAVASVLDEKQMKRFKQIQWQIAGVGALEDPEVQKTLKLSEDQQKKLAAVFEDANKKMQDLFKSGNVEGKREEFEKLRKDAEDKANNVLTDEQKKQWKEMQGEPFKPAPAQPSR